MLTKYCSYIFYTLPLWSFHESLLPLTSASSSSARPVCRNSVTMPLTFILSPDAFVKDTLFLLVSTISLYLLTSASQITDFLAPVSAKAVRLNGVLPVSFLQVSTLSVGFSRAVAPLISTLITLNDSASIVASVSELSELCINLLNFSSFVFDFDLLYLPLKSFSDSDDSADKSSLFLLIGNLL